MATAASVVVGLGTLLVGVTLGRCDAFGGRCPADRPPLLDDDVFGMAAFGAALVLLPIGIRFCGHRRRVVVVAPACLAVAVVIGLLARSVAHGSF